MIAIKPLLQSLKKMMNGRLEVVNVDKKYVVIRRQFFLKTYIKVKLHEIILDSPLLLHLSSAHAARIGYYYGLFCSKKTCASDDGAFEFLDFQDEKFPFQIYGLDRKEYLVYFDKNSTETVSESPFTILKNADLIEKFHPAQAYYIGLLAGVAVLKNNMRGNLSNQNKPILQIVK